MKPIASVFLALAIAAACASCVSTEDSRRGKLEKETARTGDRLQTSIGFLAFLDARIEYIVERRETERVAATWKGARTWAWEHWDTIALVVLGAFYGSEKATKIVKGIAQGVAERKANGKGKTE